MMRNGLLGFSLVCLLNSVCLSDMYLQGIGDDHAMSSTNDRFYIGSDKAFIGAGYDWSGVGENQIGQCAVMISPSYFLSAKHYHPDPGDTLTFHNDATAQTYTFTDIEEGILVPGTADLYLGKLSSPIPAADGIASYPILALPAQSDYVGWDMFIYGMPDRVGRNVLSSVSPLTISFTYSASGGDGPDEACVQSGDSSHPSFAYANGQLALVGIHWTSQGPVNGGICTDSFVGNFISAIQANMVGETISTTSLSTSNAWSTTSGNWTANASWSTGTAPTATGTAVFNLGGASATVNIDTASSVGTVWVRGSGILTMNGNLLTVANAITLGAGQTLQGSGSISAPSFNIEGGIVGGHVQGTPGNGVLAGGTLGGPLNLTGNVFSNGGQITPGGNTCLTVNGNLTLGGLSGVNFQLGSPSATNDQIIVNGNLNLAGWINVSALTGFGPVTGTNTCTYTGTLTNNSPVLNVGIFSAGSYSYPGTCTLVEGSNEVDLVVSFAGDTNGDRVLNSLDIDSIYQHLTLAPPGYFGTWPRTLLTWSTALAPYDVNGDGAITQDDVTYELNHYFFTNYGDADLDGASGFSDFQALLNHWQATGSGVGLAQGDFNGDGTVDFLDFQMVLNYWNPGGWNFAPSEEVPEPASVSLILLGGLALLRRKT